MFGHNLDTETNPLAPLSTRAIEEEEEEINSFDDDDSLEIQENEIGTPENKNSSARLNIGGDEENLPSTKIKKNVINTPVSLTKGNFIGKDQDLDDSKAENRIDSHKTKFSSFLENNKLKLQIKSPTLADANLSPVESSNSKYSQNNHLTPPGSSRNNLAPTNSSNSLKPKKSPKSILKVQSIHNSPTGSQKVKASPLAKNRKMRTAKTKLSFISSMTRTYSNVSSSNPTSLKFQKFQTQKTTKLKDTKSKWDCGCTFFKNLFFGNIPPLFRISDKRKLDRVDLGALPNNLRAKNLVKDFERIYYKELDKSSNRILWKTIFKFSKKEILLAVTLRVISDFIMISVPLLIRMYAKGLKAFSSGGDFQVSTLILRLFTVLVAITLQDLTREHSMKKIALCKTKTGQALRSVLFEKLVVADYNFLNIADPSFLSRLILFEFTNLNEFIGAMPALVSSPLAIAFSAVLVIIQLEDLNILFMGTATMIMVSLILLLLNWLTKKVTKGRDQYSRIESKSAIKLQELVTNINFVRVNSFQNIFNKMLVKLRNSAETALRLVHRSYGVIEFILILTPFLFGVVIAILYNFTSESKIEASQTITIVSMMVAVTIPMRALSDSLRQWRIAEVAYKCINSFFETLIYRKKELVDDSGIRIGEVEFSNCYFVSDQGASVKRVNDVFNEVSKEDLKKAKKKAKKAGGEPGLRKSYTLIRSRSQKINRVIPTKAEMDQQLRHGHRMHNLKNVLKNLTFKIRKGEKVCMIGREGCGKKQVFLALMSEIQQKLGSIKHKGRIAYMDMDNPKFLKGTIRENIILGHEFYKDKFNKILEVVDFNLDKYEGRDLTEIVEGQRNITMEDKRRILMARLLYSDADIVLINKFFDQLSKDQQQPIYDKIVRKHLKQKTVIYTSNVNLVVKQSDRLLVFSNGQLVENDTYDNLISQRQSLTYEVIMTDSTGSSNFFGKILEGLRIYPKAAKNLMLEDIKEFSPNKFRFARQMSRSPTKKQFQFKNKRIHQVVENWMGRRMDRIRGKRFLDESQKVLKNEMSTLKAILFARGKLIVIFLICIFLLMDIALVSIQFWLAFWTNDTFNLDYNTSLMIYIGLFLIVAILQISREIFFSDLMLTNLTKIYNKCVTCILDAREQWFNENPSSRVVYLLTKDQLVVDNQFIRSVFIVFDAFLILMIIFVTLNFFYYGTFVFVTIILFYTGSSLYRKFGRVASRLISFISKSRAEMIDIYLDMFQTLTMLRNLDNKNYFRKEFYRKTDEYQIATTCLGNHSMRWLNIRISLFSLMAIISILGLPLISKMYLSEYYLTQNWQFSYATTVGPFLIASILNFSRYFPQLTMNLISAQRIYYYIFDEINKLENRSQNLISADDPISSDSDSDNPDTKKKTIPKVISKLMHRFRTKLLTPQRQKPVIKVKRSRKKPTIKPDGNRSMRRSLSLKMGDGKVDANMIRMEVINKFKQNFRIARISRSIGKKDKNLYELQTKPVIYMKNVNYSTPNMNILKKINFRVYEAERVALIADKNSGRESLINLLMLNVKRDDTDNFATGSSSGFLSDAQVGTTRIPNLGSKVAMSLINQLEPSQVRNKKLNTNFKKLDKNLEDSKQSYFEMMSKNVDYCNPKQMRKQILYLNQYPAFFAGTVKENIDPDDQFDTKDIIRTLHFLKTFEALQSFTGFHNAEEIALTLKQKEGLLEVKEIDVDDFFSAGYQETQKRKSKMYFTGGRGLSHATLMEIKKAETEANKKRRRESIAKERMLEDLKNVPVTKQMVEAAGDKDKLAKIRTDIVKSGVMVERETRNDIINEFFQEQLDDEIEKAERAKRIDERLQEFDHNYSTHRVIYIDEYLVVQEFLGMNVGQNAKNINASLRKIMQLTRAFLLQPKVVILDEDALVISGFDPKFYIEQLFENLRDSAIVSITKNYRQLYHYTRAYILSEGRIVESGHPLNLVDNKRSKLYKILVKDDIRTLRQLENKLEKNIRKFEEDTDANVKYIQELMKLEMEKEAEEERLNEISNTPKNSSKLNLQKQDSNLNQNGLGVIKEAPNGELDDSRVDISPIHKIDDSGFVDKDLSQQVTLATKKGFELNLTPAPELSHTELKFTPQTLSDVSDMKGSPVKLSFRKKKTENLNSLQRAEGLDADMTTKIDSKTGASAIDKSLKLASDYSDGTESSENSFDARSNLSMDQSIRLSLK